MIHSIEIRNYRNLKELKINAFSRVNLVTGKNNVGKTALLEGIAIYALKGSVSILNEIINDRGENLLPEENTVLENNRLVYASLFNRRIPSYNSKGALYVGVNNTDGSAFRGLSGSSVSLRFVKCLQPDNAGENFMNGLRPTEVIEDDDNRDITLPDNLGMEISYNNKTHVIPFNIEVNEKEAKNFPGSERCSFVKPNCGDNKKNETFWERIALTDKEAYLIDALRIIEPKIEKITFIGNKDGGRMAVAKLNDEKTILPLKALGEGINRILSIILALLNSENGYLLIDEFENGLHHSVQRKLWDLIFKLSEKLDVQVFVTTHSLDVISGFEYILNNRENNAAGKLIRLENKKGLIRETEFTAKDLEVATDSNIEIR